MPKAAQFLPFRSELLKEKGVNLKICQCSGCGLVQLSGRPVPYYREVVRAAAFSPEMKAFRKNQFSTFVQKYGLSGKRIIELGCGGGEYLRIMRGAGTKASGIEYSRNAVRDCLRNGLDVSRTFLGRADMKLTRTPFQAFYILNFLEHLPDPSALLSGIGANLSSGGVGLVEVPDFDMMMRKSIFFEFIPDHLFYFTRATLEFLLNLNGFEVLESASIWHDYILSTVVRKRGPSDLSGFRNSRSELKTSLGEFISGFKPSQVAIWGAGHQALAVMALSGLSGKIKYVVDSATFKQGRYTPATHIPIVSPDTLNSSPVDAVIIMAASYSDEVAKILKLKFNRKLKIAVLRDTHLEILR